MELLKHPKEVFYLKSLSKMDKQEKVKRQWSLILNSVHQVVFIMEWQQ